MKNADKPAHPVAFTDKETKTRINAKGLSKREHISMTLMASLISNADRHSQVGDPQIWNYEHLSKIAISAADELLKQLEQ